MHQKHTKGNVYLCVLDTFLKHNIEFECVAGVSAGALNNAMSYITKQKGRSAKINLTNIVIIQNHIGRKAIRKNKGIIGYDYLFGDISGE